MSLEKYAKCKNGDLSQDEGGYVEVAQLQTEEDSHGAERDSSGKAGWTKITECQTGLEPFRSIH